VNRKPAAILLVLSLAVLAIALVPAAGIAAKGGNGRPSGGAESGTVELVLLEAGDTVASFGERVTFRVSTNATSYPYVTLKCTRADVLVYQASRGIFAGSLGQEFTLGPTGSWSGGDADCTATLEDWDSYSKNGRITTLASTAFHVYG
jgi:hypothetical protein